jgi:hypothetical protein
MCGRDGSDIQKPSTLVLVMFKMRLRCGAGDGNCRSCATINIFLLESYKLRSQHREHRKELSRYSLLVLRVDSAFVH